MFNGITETSRFSIDVLNQTVKDLVQEPALATKGSALGAIAQIEQFTDESFENASRILSNLVAGTTRLNPQNLLFQPETLAIAGLAVTALAYAKFGPAGAGAVALVFLAVGCNEYEVGSRDPKECQNYYPDTDGDGYGDENAETECLSESEIEDLENYSTNNDDCDDSTDTVNSGAAEICDGIDNDCDDLVDDDDSNVVGRSTWYADNDGDFYTVSSDLEEACIQPGGYILSSNSLGEDCDDDRADIGPAQTWYTDADGDTYGSSDLDPITACEQPSGYVADNTDCDDTSELANPGIAKETCSDELDNECDGYVDYESATKADCLSNVGSRTEGIKFQGDVGSLAGGIVSGLDLDGDGNEDLLVGAQAMDAPAPYPNTGGVYAAYGPFSTTTDPVVLSNYGIALAGENEGDLAGSAISPVGDVDGYGGTDFLVGAYGNDTNGVYAGVAYLVTGEGLPGSSAANPHELINYAYAVLRGNGADDNAGYSVASNGNGSVVVGAPGASLVYLISNPNSGTQNLEDVFDLKLESEGSSDRAGTTLAMGILDGDGNRNDLLVGAYQYDGFKGVVYVCQNVDSLSGKVFLSETCFEIFGLSADDQLGGSDISWDGDVDDNGYDDILVGSVPLGAAYLFLGDSVEDEVDLGTLSLTLNEADAKFLANDPNSNASSALAIGGLDGDRFDEIMIGASSDDTVGNSSGAAYLFYGNSSDFLGGATHLLPADADLTLLGESQDDEAGGSAAFVGDNLLIGARNESSNGTAAGAAYLLLGL